MIRQRLAEVSRLRAGADADLGGDGCLAPAGQWRGPHLDIARAQCAGRSASTSISCRRMAFRPFRCRLIRDCAWPCRARGRSRAASSRPSPTRSISRPKGPIGQMVRAYCQRRGRPFTTSYTTRFPEYISARAPIPESWIYAGLRRFHAAAAVTMVATPSLMSELGAARLFQSRHVDARRRYRSVQARPRD